MKNFDSFSKQEWDVVVLGGGCTGAGILRDLAMRGLKTLLLEQRDLAHGTSSRFHGLLHSGGRYAVGDPEAGRECIEENTILRRIGQHCVEYTEGLFVRTPEDDPEYEPHWLEACAHCGIKTTPVTVHEARRLEPNLSPAIKAVYKVPDAGVDGFRLVWQNALSARRHGGHFSTYTKVTGIEQTGGRVTGVRVQHSLTGETGVIPCRFVVNASGSWVSRVAALAGLEIHVRPDRGTLLAFNHRITDRVINRLHKSGDGDIFVPHGSITILGTTSSNTNDPEDTTPTMDEVLALLELGRPLFPGVDQFRILRAFSGTRPLYMADNGAGGRSASRNFVVLDHEKDGLSGMASICGGKLTTYRLMAERMSDLVCAKLGVTAPCTTADELLVPPISDALCKRAAACFPAQGTALAASRLGDGLEAAVARMEAAPWKKTLLCECELVTVGEFEEVASEPSSHSLNDIRRRTRMGMGTCQGGFCGLRGAGALLESGLYCQNDESPENGEAGAPQNEPLPCKSGSELLRDFQEERWHGFRPVLWGGEVRECELARGIYAATLNIDGADSDV